MKLLGHSGSIYAVGLLVFQLGCGGGPGDASSDGSGSGETHISNASLLHYADLFVLRGRENGRPITLRGITIQFADLDRASGGKRILGSCDMENKVVRVNSVMWDSLTTTDQELVIFHELGHCILHRGHDESLHSSGFRPNSVMNPTLLGELYYKLYYSEYMHELF